MTDSLLDDVSDLISCPICTNLLSNPKTLSCTHTFCFECLKKWVSVRQNSNASIDCPMCREPFNIPIGGLQTLPNNLIVDSIVELVRRTDGAGGLVQRRTKRSYCVVCQATYPSYLRYSEHRNGPLHCQRFAHDWANGIKYTRCELCNQRTLTDDAYQSHLREEVHFKNSGKRAKLDVGEILAGNSVVDEEGCPAGDSDDDDASEPREYESEAYDSDTSDSADDEDSVSVRPEYDYTSDYVSGDDASYTAF